MKEHQAVHKFRWQSWAPISQSTPSEGERSLRRTTGWGHTEQAPSDFDKLCPCWTSMPTSQITGISTTAGQVKKLSQSVNSPTIPAGFPPEWIPRIPRDSRHPHPRAHLYTGRQCLKNESCFAAEYIASQTALGVDLSPVNQTSQNRYNRSTTRVSSTNKLLGYVLQTRPLLLSKCLPSSESKE